MFLREGFTARHMFKLQPKPFSFIVCKTIRSVQITLTGNLPLKTESSDQSRRREISHKNPFVCFDSMHKVHFRVVSTTCNSAITDFNFVKAYGYTKASRKTNAQI